MREAGKREGNYDGFLRAPRSLEEAGDGMVEVIVEGMAGGEEAMEQASSPEGRIFFRIIQRPY
jgi:hypothetical protein